MYQLIALDLDGTLIDRDLVISSRNKRAIRTAMDRGITVTLATGRMFQSTLPFAQELQIAVPIICYQGAMIGHPVTREVLWHKPVPLSLAHRVMKFTKAQQLHINAYFDDELYVDNLTEEAELYSQISRVTAHLIEDQSMLLNKEPTKLVIIGTEEEIDVFTKELKTEFGSALFITKSFPKFCEVAHPDCSKSQALAQVAKRLGIPQSETVAIGDSPNDLDMVEWAGLGIAMSNGAPEVKDAADFVTGSIGEDGVAQAIENILKML